MAGHACREGDEQDGGRRQPPPEGRPPRSEATLRNLAATHPSRDLRPEGSSWLEPEPGEQTFRVDAVRVAAR
jgi:hypothetical protein